MNITLFKLFSRIKRRTKRHFSKPSYYHHVDKQPLQPKTIGQLLEEITYTHGNQQALISKHQNNKKLTYNELLNNSDKLAAALRDLGLQKNDRIGLWAPNSTEWLIAKMACARGGFILVALNPLYKSDELKYCVNKVGISALICGDEFNQNQNYYDILCDMMPQLDESSPEKFKSDLLPFLKIIISISSNKYRSVFNFHELLSEVKKSSVDLIKKYQSNIQPDDPCNIQFTSGTTGKPKATITTHFNQVNNGYFVGKRNELDEEQQRICVMVPFFHAFGTTITIMAALNYGSTLVLPSPKYSPTKSLLAIKEEKCTIIHGTPTMYIDLVKIQEEKQLDINPKIAVTGGALFSPNLLQKLKSQLNLKKVKSVYGLTETTAVVFQSLKNEDESLSFNTVGHVGPHVEAKVVDKEGKMVPFGTPGELYIRTYSNILGYWDDEAKTKELIGADRWLKTGDIFVLEENGYGKVVGRIKDLIIRGGENISPKEIEDLLNTHPSILEAQVVGLPHERYGEEVCACVRLKSSDLTLQDVQNFCKKHIADFKIPTKLKIFKEFPKTVSGKIQKHKIVECILEE